jgi:hypothetical protein
MNMLRDEQNANYRSVIKNTIEFDPEILKRYVNFMNNPDERTAVDQFGKGDKYLGVCTLMATMPGLPMFGHGQVEGLAERYGMEFRRALWDEQADDTLVGRHEREIFPLLHRRHLFAGVENFLLYDFFTPDGAANEDVFAYSNRVNDERGLVIYHNKYANTAGWIRTAAACLDKATGKLAQRNLGAGLALHRDENHFTIFRDQASGVEFIRDSKALCDQGLYVELGAYQRHVFIDFREGRDDPQHQYAQLCASLNGRGVPSIDEARREVLLQSLHQPFRELVNADTFRRLMNARVTTSRRGDARRRPKGQPPSTALRSAQDGLPQQGILEGIEEKVLRLASEAKRFSGGTGDEIALAKQVRREIEMLLQLPTMRGTPAARRPPPAAKRAGSRAYSAAIKYLQSHHADDAVWATTFAWVFVHALARAQGDGDLTELSRRWIDEWLLGKLIAGALRDFGLSDAQAGQSVAAIKLMTAHQRWHRRRDKRENRAYRLLEAWLEDDETKQFLKVNRHNDILWFNQEAFEALVGWMFVAAVVSLGADEKSTPPAIAKEISAAHDVVKALLKAEKKSQYQVERLLAAAKQ